MKKYILHVVLPIFTGIVIYILWGSKHLIAYNWLGQSFSGFINGIQNSSLIQSAKIPNWMKYNLPDGLWLYALTSFVIFIWERKLTAHSIPWIVLCPLLAFGSEIGQKFKIIPGTYDNMDMLAYLIASVLASFHLINRT